MNNNDGIERHYAKNKAFFESMLVSLFASKLDKEFEYWGLPEDKVQEREDYTVQF